MAPLSDLNLAQTYKFPSHEKENTEKSLEFGHAADNTPRLRSCLKAVKHLFLLPGMKLLPACPFAGCFPPHWYRPLQNNGKKGWNASESQNLFSWAGKKYIWGQAEQPKPVLDFVLIEVAAKRTGRVVPACDATTLQRIKVWHFSSCSQDFAASNCPTDCFFHSPTWITNNRYL